MGIKALTFDVGGTLAEGRLDREGYRKRLFQFLRGRARDLTERDFDKGIGGMLGRLGRIRKRNREGDFVDLYSDLLVGFGIEPEPKLIEDIRRLHFENFPQHEIKGTRGVLEKLHERYKLAVISNTMSGVSRNFLDKSGLSNYFDLVVLSCDIGIRKPDPRIFLYTLEKLEVDPSEALHVGNSMMYDVAGAKGVGMGVVWIVNKGEELTHQPDYIVSSVLDLLEVVKHWRG